MSQLPQNHSLSPFERLLTEEEQIRYVETHLDELIAGLSANKSIPPDDAEALARTYANFRSQIEGGIPLEEFWEKNNFARD
jgi:hypothetical protein